MRMKETKKESPTRKEDDKVKMIREFRRGGRITLNRRGLGVGVRVARNAVYSVLRRVGVFMSGTGYRRRRHREYIGLRYRLVYVGAIAVLLRFVVMRLHVNEWSQSDVENEEELRAQEVSQEVAAKEAKGQEVVSVEEQASLTTFRLAGVVGRAVGLVAMGRSVASLREGRRGKGRVGSGRQWRMGGVVEWVEKTERQREVDEIERRPEMGQYRYTEGRKYVWLAGRVRRVSRMGAVVRTLEEGGTKGRKGKGQRIGEQLSREKVV